MRRRSAAGCSRRRTPVHWGARCGRGYGGTRSCCSMRRAESRWKLCCVSFFFFQAEDGIRDYKVTGVQTCALPICSALSRRRGRRARHAIECPPQVHRRRAGVREQRRELGEPREERLSRRPALPARRGQDRKSTRLNSSHLVISYAVFCLKKKKNTNARA